MGTTLLTSPTSNSASASSASERRRRRRVKRATLIAHILSSVGWFGAALLVCVLAFTAIVSDDDALVLGLLRSLQVAVWLTIVLGGLAAVTGVVVSLTTTWGLIRYWWVVVKQIITLLVVVTDVLVLRNVLANSVADGGPTGRLIDPTIAHTLALAVATILSVVKPWGRLRRRRVDGPRDRPA